MTRHHPSFSDLKKCICGLPMEGHPPRTIPNDAPRPTSELVKELRGATSWDISPATRDALLLEAAASLQALEDENTCFRAAYNNTVGSLNEAEGRAEDLQARIKELEGALKPFADAAKSEWATQFKHDGEWVDSQVGHFDFSTKDLRAARAALHPATKTGET